MQNQSASVMAAATQKLYIVGAKNSCILSFTSLRKVHESGHVVYTERVSVQLRSVHEKDGKCLQMWTAWGAKKSRKLNRDSEKCSEISGLKCVIKGRSELISVQVHFARRLRKRNRYHVILETLKFRALFVRTPGN